MCLFFLVFFFSSRRRHTRCGRDWSSDVCSSDLPFLYALAIDRGLALPQYLVPDVPAQYGTYRPRNFDGDFAGLVTLQDALSRSLNLPVIDLLAPLGVEQFVGELAGMGVAAEAAGPLLFDVLEAVANRSHVHRAETQPDDLVEVEVCAYSGHVPTEACDHRVKVLAPIHAVPTAPCPYHQAFDVDASGHAVVPA